MKQLIFWINTKKKTITISTLIILAFVFLGDALASFLSNDGKAPTMFSTLIAGLTHIARYIAGVVLFVALVIFCIGSIVKIINYFSDQR